MLLASGPGVARIVPPTGGVANRVRVGRPPPPPPPQPGTALKFAVTVSGPVIVTVVDCFEGAATGPVQPLNTKQLAGWAMTFTSAPASKKLPGPGSTAPPNSGETRV